MAFIYVTIILDTLALGITIPVLPHLITNFVGGPAIGGVLGTFGIRIPFWGAAAFSLASASYGLFVLPESLSKEHRQRLAWRRSNPVGSLTLLRSHPTLFGLAAVTFVQFMA